MNVSGIAIFCSAFIDVIDKLEGFDINTARQFGNDNRNNQEEVLKYVIENNIIDMTYVQDVIAMRKRKEILDAHCYSIWYSGKENCWYTYIPDETKANKRKKIKKKNKADLEIDIDDFFNSVLNEHNPKKKAFYNMCGILKQMLEYAVDAEYIEKNPYRVKVNKKKFASSSKKPSNKEVFQNGEREMFINEMERRLQNNPSNTAPLAVLLDFELGTRKGEILAISKSDIVDNRIHIHR